MAEILSNCMGRIMRGVIIIINFIIIIIIIYYLLLLLLVLHMLLQVNFIRNIELSAVNEGPTNSRKLFL